VRNPLSPVHPLRLPQTCAHCHADKTHMASTRFRPVSSTSTGRVYIERSRAARRPFGAELRSCRQSRSHAPGVTPWRQFAEPATC
jgi:hypothetical protein